MVMSLGIRKRKKLPPEVRFFKYVVRREDGCWEWTGGKSRTGYGHFYCGPSGPYQPARRAMAHRWSYEHHVGPIPDGFETHHLCGNRRCVNPAHVQPMPYSEHCRQPGHCGVMRAHITHCPKGHEYTAENTRVKKGCRNCKACDRDLHRERYRQRVGWYRSHS